MAEPSAIGCGYYRTNIVLVWFAKGDTGLTRGSLKREEFTERSALFKISSSFRTRHDLRRMLNAENAENAVNVVLKSIHPNQNTD